MGCVASQPHARVASQSSEPAREPTTPWSTFGNAGDLFEFLRDKQQQALSQEVAPKYKDALKSSFIVSAVATETNSTEFHLTKGKRAPLDDAAALGNLFPNIGPFPNIHALIADSISASAESFRGLTGHIFGKDQLPPDLGLGRLVGHGSSLDWAGEEEARKKRIVSIIKSYCWAVTIDGDDLGDGFSSLVPDLLEQDVVVFCFKKWSDHLDTLVPYLYGTSFGMLFKGGVVNAAIYVNNKSAEKFASNFHYVMWNPGLEVDAERHFTSCFAQWETVFPVDRTALGTSGESNESLPNFRLSFLQDKGMYQFEYGDVDNSIIPEHAVKGYILSRIAGNTLTISIGLFRQLFWDFMMSIDAPGKVCPKVPEYNEKRLVAFTDMLRKDQHYLKCLEGLYSSLCTQWNVMRYETESASDDGVPGRPQT